MGELSLRPASADDAAFLLKVYASTRAEEMAHWGWPPEQQEMFVRMQFHARRQSYLASFPGADHSILVSADGPVGSMIVSRSASEIRLVDIAFLAEHRGRGFGAQVISDLIHESQLLKVPLRLSVLRGNPAIHLYQRLGFVPLPSDAMYIEMEQAPTSPSESHHSVPKSE